MSIRVHVIPNRSSPPAVLLRKTWREGKRIRRQTLANLSKVPKPVVDAIRAFLQGGVVFETLDDAAAIRRSLPHGHIAALLGLATQLGLPRILNRKPCRQRDLALAAVIARLIHPASKLATARALSPETADSSLGVLLGLGGVSGNELLDMLDWLSNRQPWIEQSLSRRHLHNTTLILYDVTSTYLEGQQCPLAAFGHNRDGKKGKKQMVFGLLCAADGCPVAVEVFPGNTADPTRLAAQVRKIRDRFGVRRVALVGDRGMITSARIRTDLLPVGLDWISALRTVDLRKLLKAPRGNPAGAPLRPEALVPDTVAEILSPEFPGERLLVCFNPRLRQQRARKREDLLRATEATLAKIAAAARKHRPGPENRDRTLQSLGRQAHRHKVEKHFHLTVTDDDLQWSRNRERIKAEARLDGIYVIRTNLDTAAIDTHAAVAAYKSLSQVERAFRSMKTTRLHVRSVFVYTEQHVLGHVFLCLLAWYLEWHLRRRLAPLLFEDEAPPVRDSPVQRAERSQQAKTKAATKRTPDGDPVHSVTTLLYDLATVTLNEVTLPGHPDSAFPLVTKSTPLQAKVFALLKIDPEAAVAINMTG